MYHILVADDDPQIRELVIRYGEFSGFAVTEVSDGTEVLKLCETESFDVLILDIMMPGLNGYSTCMELRRNPKTAKLPIIFCSARGEEYDRIHGFELGCDDYVVKPFSPRELMLRVKALIRRTRGLWENEDVFQLRGLIVNLAAHTAEVNGVRINLPPKEYMLLHYLIQNRGAALPRQQLLAAVWGEDYYGNARTLDTHVKMLRHSLGEYGRLIVTVRGIGYRFEA